MPVPKANGELFGEQIARLKGQVAFLSIAVSVLARISDREAFEGVLAAVPPPEIGLEDKYRQTFFDGYKAGKSYPAGISNILDER